MNPDANDLQVFGLPGSTPARTAEALAELATSLLDTMDSTSDDDYATYFLGNSPNADPPSRSGDYVGYLIVERAAGTKSLAQLAKLQPAVVRELVERELRTMSMQSRQQP